MKRALGIFTFLAALISASISQAAPLDFDFFGNIQFRNDVVRFDISVSTPGSRTFFTSSWDDGGFDPMIGVWTAAGNLIAFQDDGLNIGSTVSNGVAYTHSVFDSFFDVFLNPGDYILTLSAFPNFNVSNTLSAGFDFDDDPLLPVFADPNFALHILGVDSASIEQPIPEPASLLLVGLGAAGVSWLRRRKG